MDDLREIQTEEVEEDVTVALERTWVQLSTEEKVESLRRVVQALICDFEDHQHAVSGIVVVPPEGLRGTLS